MSKFMSYSLEKTIAHELGHLGHAKNVLYHYVLLYQNLGEPFVDRLDKDIAGELVNLKDGIGHLQKLILMQKTEVHAISMENKVSEHYGYPEKELVYKNVVDGELNKKMSGKVLAFVSATSSETKFYIIK